MEIIKSQYPKINILDWCKHCNQGWVCIIKNKYTNELYCECDEDFSLWYSPEDYEKGVYTTEPTEDRFHFKCMKEEDPYVLASEEDIINKGWNSIINKVHTCSVCFINNKPHGGWIVIKKDKDTGKLFCRCETCGSIWEDIRNVLKKGVVPVSNEVIENVKDYDEITRELLIRALIPPSNPKIENFEDATREEIIAAGWDIYDDVYFIKDEIINPIYKNNKPYSIE